MTWNYRVIEKEDNSKAGVEHFYEVHEVYYNEEGAITSWTEKPVGPTGDSIGELRAVLEMFGEALDKPVLRVQAQGAESDKLVETDVAAKDT